MNTIFFVALILALAKATSGQPLDKAGEELCEWGFDSWENTYQYFENTDSVPALFRYEQLVQKFDLH